MNYIKKLQAENKELKDSLQATRQATLDLYSYCASEKFAGVGGYGGNTYINKNDVFLRLEPIFNAIIL